MEAIVVSPNVKRQLWRRLVKNWLKQLEIYVPTTPPPLSVYECDDRFLTLSTNVNFDSKLNTVDCGIE